MTFVERSLAGSLAESSLLGPKRILVRQHTLICLSIYTVLYCIVYCIYILSIVPPHEHFKFRRPESRRSRTLAEHAPHVLHFPFQPFNVLPVSSTPIHWVVLVLQNFIQHKCQTAYCTLARSPNHATGRRTQLIPKAKSLLYLYCTVDPGGVTGGRWHCRMLPIA